MTDAVTCCLLLGCKRQIATFPRLESQDQTKGPDIIGRLFPTRLDIHGHDARSMSDQAASADNDAFAGLPCFGIVSKRVIAHFLLYLKPPGLLAFLLRDGFVNINRHMKSTSLNVKVPFFLI